MAGTLFKAGPAYLAATSEDIAGVNPSANTYRELRHIHLACDTTAQTFSLWIGATGAEAAGTAIIDSMALAAAGVYDYYCLTRLATTDFLVGKANTDATSITILVEGYTYAL
jgi:hypothetical protein